MTPEKKICVFSLSDRDIFKSNDMNFAINWLLRKGENPYYFRSSKPKSLPKGSLVLFSFNARVFGQATVKQEPREVPFDEQKEVEKADGFTYKYKMNFDPSQTHILNYYPAKKDITERLGIRFGQLYTYLDFNQYQEVMKMAKT